MSGWPSNPGLIRKAREEELEYAKTYEVFEIVDEKVCLGQDREGTN